jgi:transportin-1
MEPFINPLLSRLVPILVGTATARSLKENAAITIGRLGFACPELIAPHLGQFIQKWFFSILNSRCESLNMVHDNAEKESAFRGICKAIQLNPNAIVPFYAVYCDAVLKWNVAKIPELHQIFHQVSPVSVNILDFCHV